MTARVLPLSALKGLGPARIKALSQAGITSVHDLLMTLPVRYKDTLNVTPVANLHAGQTVCVQGRIMAPARLARFKGRTLVTAKLSDGTGTVRIQYFNQPWMADQLQQDREVLLYGPVAEYRGSLQLSAPSIERERGLLPVYRPLPGMKSGPVAGLIAQMLDRIDECVTESLPESTRTRRSLCEINYALREVHRPQSYETLAIARRRLTFENLLMFVTAMRLNRDRVTEGIPMDVPGNAVDEYWNALPFPPTGAQRRALSDIASDLRKPVAMSRLVQGDVGCGKTAVALGAILMCVKAGYQAALMAPTEILARQHLESAQETLSAYNIRVGLLVGGLKTAERKQALSAIANDEWQLVIGTHALFSADVRYDRLGLIVTDEQHRFGVRQRRMLEDKASLSPHVLVMSATPIPRSLALVMYGDLDISTIDEMPPGRTPVNTRIVPENKRDGLYRFICGEATAGRQTYIVCPLVDESETLDVPSAQQVYAELSSGPLSSLSVGLTYGSQNPEEKAQTIADFTAGRLQVLVSTTVIEVGVNVPAATIMVIESADRFGLSQLHQLRGRVGRGGGTSWCFLMAAPNERLNALVRTSDGFEIAQEDLRQRGPGDLMGVRQHGQTLPPGMKEGFDIGMITEAADELNLLKAPGSESDYAMVRAEALRRYEQWLSQITMN